MTIGLYGGGAVAKSLVARIPSLRARLGPVAASSARVASRIANSMRAGRPVREYGELAEAGIILVCVPEEALTPAVADLSAAPADWAGKIVLLCDTPGESRDLRPLRDRSAATGSFNPLPGTLNRYVVEGDREAVRFARGLIKELNGKALELDPSRIALYRAGLSFTSTLFTPLIAACAECMAEAGAGSPDGVAIASELFQNTVRSYLNAGRKSWSDIGAAERRQVEALRQVSPALAKYFEEALEFSRGMMGKR